MNKKFTRVFHCPNQPPISCLWNILNTRNSKRMKTFDIGELLLSRIQYVRLVHDVKEMEVVIWQWYSWRLTCEFVRSSNSQPYSDQMYPLADWSEAGIYV